MVFVITLIVVGPQRFPEIMRSAGRWYRMARAYSNEVMRDVRSAVDDIEREVKAETDDLKSVREFADIGRDLKEAQQDAAAIGRETNNVLREPTPAASTTVRPSQRAQAAAASDDLPGATTEAIPPIEQPTAADAATAAPVTPAGPVTTAEPVPSVSSFDPFKKAPPKKGPVLIPRESAPSTSSAPSASSAPSEGDERT